jgi:hypothetical protein
MIVHINTMAPGSPIWTFKRPDAETGFSHVDMEKTHDAVLKVMRVYQRMKSL